MDRYTPEHFIALIQRHGIAFHEKTEGQLFCDGSARAVVAMLLLEAKSANVDLRLAHQISGLSKSDQFRVETDHGALSESQVILEYLEERYPEKPMFPSDPFARAKCRELIQHLELNVEWVARRLYKESFFGGSVSEEAKRETQKRLPMGLEAVAQLSYFSPYIFGPAFSAADCAAYMHFLSIKITTLKIYGENMLDKFFPDLGEYLQLMDSRPNIKKVMAERELALAAFLKIDVKYEG